MSFLLKVCRVVFHIGILYLFYLFGEWISSALDLFIPGSVIGMLVFFLLLMTNVIKEQWITEGTTLMVDHLAFFFIPVTSGLIIYLDLFVGKGLLLIIIGLFSTILVMGGSGLISQWLYGRKGVHHE